MPFISYWINTSPSPLVQKPDILNYCLQHCFKPVWIVLIDDPVLLICQNVIAGIFISNKTRFQNPSPFPTERTMFQNTEQT